jgi:ribosomal protein L24E
MTNRGHIPPVRAFGEWDAPVTDEAEWIDTPVGATCMYCGESIQNGDNGAIMPNGYVQHRECSLRSVWGGIGHHVNHARYCGGELGPDAGLTYRESAILVWRLFHGTAVTEEALSERR